MAKNNEKKINLMGDMPHSLEAEQALLGCVIIDNEIIVTLSDEMKIQDFFDRRHQIIFQAMLNLYRGQMQIDFTTLIAELQMKNQLVEAGGAVYLSSLVDAVYTTANISDYIQIVQDSALKRNVIAAATSIGDAGYNSNYEFKLIPTTASFAPKASLTSSNILPISIAYLFSLYTFLSGNKKSAFKVAI